MVGKGGMPPLGLRGIQHERGQAALPNLELIYLETSSFSIFQLAIRKRSTQNSAL